MSDDGENSAGIAAAFVSGRVQGLIGLTLAMARTHPDPQLLLREIEAMEIAAAARAEATVVPDEFLEGVQDVVRRVRSILQARLEPPGPRSNLGRTP